jgi:signal transduction histidine kinase
LQQTLTSLELLASKLPSRPSELRDLVGTARDAQRELARLFEDLHHHAAALRLQREILRLRDVWREAWADLKELYQEKTGDFQESIQGDLLYADRFRLKQVFRNLFENALSACPVPVRIEVSCARITLANGRPVTRVIVHDNGPGLSPEQRQRAFEPFYTTKANGTGLGLAITKGFVEAHGGQISIDGGANAGARFIILLPHEQEIVASVEPVPTSATDSGPGRIDRKPPAPKMGVLRRG